MKYLMSYSLFESWKPNFDRQQIFDAIPWYDANRDLYPGYSEESELNMASDEYWFETKENAEQYADELIDLLDSLPDPVPIYRAIQAKSVEDIDVEYPGESWSFEKQSAMNFGHHNGSNYLMEAKIKKEFVNWAGTINAYILFSGGYTDEDENELVIDEQDKIEDLRIKRL